MAGLDLEAVVKRHEAARIRTEYVDGSALAVRASLADIPALVEAVRAADVFCQYARHDEGCSASVDRRYRCKCGFQEAYDAMYGEVVADA